MISTALAHLGRDAFFMRDNPYASLRAGQPLPGADRALLTELLDGREEASSWLARPRVQALLNRIDVACLPRDLQLTGDRSVTVTSVHAVIRAPLIFWLVSVLWCMTLGRKLDALLDEGIKGYRLHRAFLEDPATASLLFYPPARSYKAWRRHVVTASRALLGQTLAANTVDVANFYYSVTARPTELVSATIASARTDPFLSDNAPVDLDIADLEQTLTRVLDSIHSVYSERSLAIAPRDVASESGSLVPLPVGIPSSRILANGIIGLALGDLMQQDAVRSVAAYADDLVVLTPDLPKPLESITDYFARLELVDGNHCLNAPRAAEHARLEVNIEKSGTSYSRSVGRPEESEAGDEDDVAEEMSPLDPYLSSDPGPEWGGPLRTVLRAPQRRERSPHALERKLAELVGEIAVGLDAATVKVRLSRLVEGMDASVFLRLRRYWTDLAIAGIAADGPEHAVKTLTDDFVGAVNSLEVTPGTPREQTVALMEGLRASWISALGHALAVAASRPDRLALAREMPMLVTGASVADIAMPVIARYSEQIRDRSLVPQQFVSVPLSEFTTWEGKLLGAGVLEAFIAWARNEADLWATIEQRVRRSVRYVRLHEACLAVHLWALPEDPEWLSAAFRILRNQPLTKSSDLAELEALARAAVGPRTPSLPESEDERRRLVLRIAMPSMEVDSRHLAAILGNEDEVVSEIVGRAREHTRTVVRAATRNRASVLVLPEWSLLPQQLNWLMDQSRRADMLIVGGQAPSVADGRYANRLWTGLPIVDSLRRRSCLVPPPREKQHLSPHEQRPLELFGLSHSPSSGVPVYSWRGLGVASLICFEFADIAIRHQVRRTADLMTVSSWNQDWRYFEAVQESTTRDNYCVTLCVNTSQFPGTRLMRPTRSEKSVVASVHGSDSPTVVLRRLDLLPIVAARAHRASPADVLEEAPQDDASLEDYKPVPPVW